MQGQLFGCNDAPFNGRVFYIDQGRRRWVGDASALQILGLTWPDDVQWVKSGWLKNIPLGPPLPISKKVTKNSLTMNDMRQNCVSLLLGNGVEFGAAANPLSIPIGVKIQYADLFSKPQLEDELYDNSEYEFVDTDIVSGFDEMKNIENNSMDFIIASHVIEHVRDPIGALDLAWGKLRNNGKLTLIIPKKEKTLDKNRELTTLEHLILDHAQPNRWRDALHVAEFYSKAKPLSSIELYEKMLESIRDEKHSMHYHVWNEKSFKKLINYVRKIHHPWRILMSNDALPGPQNYEFYIVLEKTQ
ncbi:MAG: class I SAM-dependent methyltransferase [bacterium]|nr:class I SAM-dependent methyltransferase [bacterium]